MKRFKIPRLAKPKKLLTATARRASAGMDFEGIPEPNMKLSRALLIVLLLHVVAVSGIIAFNAIKTREQSFAPPVTEETEARPIASTGASDKSVATKPQTAAAQNEGAKHADLKSLRAPAKEEHEKKPSSSGKTYVVKKGDNPVTIAKKLQVSYSDLIALNHIDDPRKLQIGQKLLVPETASSKATSAKATHKKKKQNEISNDKSDAKTHRTPKPLRAKSTETRASFRASFWSALASSRCFDALTFHAS